jgi:hypothetical protein
MMLGADSFIGTFTIVGQHDASGDIVLLEQEPR